MTIVGNAILQRLRSINDAFAFEHKVYSADELQQSINRLAQAMYDLGKSDCEIRLALMDYISANCGLLEYFKPIELAMQTIKRK